MSEANQTEPASFRQRAAAYMIDTLIVGPLDRLILIGGCFVLGPMALMALLVAKGLAVFLYRPLCHARWERTIGKRCLRLRVVRCDGGALTWPRAFLREVFFIPGLLFGIIASIMALQHSPEIGSYANYKSVMATFYRGDAAMWLQVLMSYNFAMMLLQAGLVLFHPRHRALHDLVAGTLVVHEFIPPAQHKFPVEEIPCLACGAKIANDAGKCPSCGWSYEDEGQGDGRGEENLGPQGQSGLPGQQGAVKKSDMSDDV